LLEMQKPKIEIIKNTPTEGVFVIKPLERGYGYTLGNTLRRVLISSIPGAAATSIKIDGVHHEFSTIPGVREDTTELILNLKKLVLKSSSEEPITMRIEKKGKCDIYAKDIIAPSEVEIVNKDLYIASLNEDGKLKMEINVERGRGYVAAEENKKGKEIIDLIFIDSIFTPVINVGYDVDSTRVGHKSNYDKLTLKIKTNGAVTPDFALSQTAKILSDHMKVLMDITEIVLFDIFIKEEEKPKEKEEIPVEELNLSVRPYNCLKKEGIVYISNLCDYTEQQLKSIRNLGIKSLNEIKKKLEERELTLKKV